ncbi:lysoplasmalogenase [bacterium]|nr:lysoplasmalogenase [bacterium]
MPAKTSFSLSSSALRWVDLAFAAAAVVLFVSAQFGLNPEPAGGLAWRPVEWKWVHDVAKGLLLPMLALRFWLSVTEQHADRGLQHRVGLAMGFCWIGDMVLTLPGDLAFLAGLVSFLSGHLMFLVVFRWLLRTGAPRSSKPLQGLVMVLLFGVLTPTISHLSGAAGGLAPAVVVYALVIATMAYFTWVLGNGPGVMALRVGAIFFLISDLMLAFSRFGDAPIEHEHFWVMSTYILAQACLTSGFIRAAKGRSDKANATN